VWAILRLSRGAGETRCGASRDAEGVLGEWAIIMSAVTTTSSQSPLRCAPAWRPDARASPAALPLAGEANGRSGDSETESLSVGTLTNHVPRSD
jgi:hypothetical protein